MKHFLPALLISLSIAPFLGYGQDENAAAKAIAEELSEEAAALRALVEEFEAQSKKEASPAPQQMPTSAETPTPVVEKDEPKTPSIVFSDNPSAPATKTEEKPKVPAVEAPSIVFSDTKSKPAITNSPDKVAEEAAEMEKKLKDLASAAETRVESAIPPAPMKSEIKTDASTESASNDGSPAIPSVEIPSVEIPAPEVKKTEKIATVESLIASSKEEIEAIKKEMADATEPEAETPKTSIGSDTIVIRDDSQGKAKMETPEVGNSAATTLTAESPPKIGSDATPAPDTTKVAKSTTPEADSAAPSVAMETKPAGEEAKPKEDVDMKPEVASSETLGNTESTKKKAADKPLVVVTKKKSSSKPKPAASTEKKESDSPEMAEADVTPTASARQLQPKLFSKLFQRRGSIFKNSPGSGGSSRSTNAAPPSTSTSSGDATTSSSETSQ